MSKRVATSAVSRPVLALCAAVRAILANTLSRAGRQGHCSIGTGEEALLFGVIKVET